MFPLKRYLGLTRGSIMESLVFRSSILVTILGNIVYLIIIYNLWKAIFASNQTDVVNGMTFSDTMIYLVLASALFNFMNCFIIWGMGRDFQSGQIVVHLLKPSDYQLFWFFSCSGNYVISYLTTFLPTFIIVYIITNGSFELGINIIFFCISVCMSVLLNFFIDFFVGTICLYTQSIWGVNIMKEVVVALLSGATVPLAFFPEKLHAVVNLLPFQAIYNTPLQILIDQSLIESNYLTMLCKQCFWVIIMLLISRYFWYISRRVITVNGG
jgi:ABC-2 type transport system permease protein